MFILLLVVSVWSCAQDAPTAIDYTEKELKTIQLFERMDLQGVDLSGPLMYGYFFLGSDKGQLESMSSSLQSAGYTQVNLSEAENEQFFLHLQKVEQMSGQSMVNRSVELESLCSEYRGASYDGWDVGAVDPMAELTTMTQFEQGIAKVADADLFERSMRIFDQELYEHAKFAFNLCIEKEIQQDTAYYKRAFCELQMGDRDQAIQSWKKAVELNPGYEKAIFNLAATFYDILDFDACIQHYEKVLALNPNNDQAWYGIAAAQYGQKDHEAAKASCQKALELNPQNLLARQMMKYFR